MRRWLATLLTFAIPAFLVIVVVAVAVAAETIAARPWLWDVLVTVATFGVLAVVGCGLYAILAAVVHRVRP